MPTSCSPLEVVRSRRSTSIVLSTGAGTFQARPGCGEHADGIAKAGHHDGLAGPDQNQAGADSGRRDDHERDEEAAVAREPAPLRRARFRGPMVAMVMMVMAVADDDGDRRHDDPELEAASGGVESVIVRSSVVVGLRRE